ncbi:hypothetical protein FACS18945_3190 [Bacteroidia bacterium]|nr:hypothetical protein FACS18945_3190 [Bacteroidia bacterium]
MNKILKIFTVTLIMSRSPKGYAAFVRFLHRFACITLLIVMFLSTVKAADLSGYIQQADSQIEKLMREREQKMSDLNSCAKTVKGFQIATGIGGGLTAAGIIINVKQSGIKKDLDTKIATEDKRIAEEKAAAIKAKEDAKAKVDCEKDLDKEYKDGKCTDKIILPEVKSCADGETGKACKIEDKDGIEECKNGKLVCVEKTKCMDGSTEKSIGEQIDCAINNVAGKKTCEKDGDKGNKWSACVPIQSGGQCTITVSGSEEGNESKNLERDNQQSDRTEYYSFTLKGVTTSGQCKQSLNNVDVSGLATCSTNDGTYTRTGNPQTATDDNAKHCWCKLDDTSIVGSSAWVFLWSFDSAGDCAYNCAYNCAYHVRDDGGFRAAVFASLVIPITQN